MTRRSAPSTLHVCTSFACEFENSCLRACLSHFNFTLTGEVATKIVGGLVVDRERLLAAAIDEGHLGRGRLDRDARVDLLQLPHGGLFRALLGRQIAGLIAEAAAATALRRPGPRVSPRTNRAGALCRRARGPGRARQTR